MNDNSAVRALPPEGGAKRQKKPRKRGIEGVAAQTVLIVFLLILLFLTLLPVLITLIMSFKDANDITSNSVWSFPQNGWHFSNYASAFTDTYSYMINTIIITFISVVVTMLLSCYIAFLFVRKHFAGKNVLFFLIIIPMLVPAVVTLSPTYITVLGLGLDGTWWALILPYIAGNQIASIFLLRTFIGQHPADLYEAGEIDGAGVFRQFFNICLPLAVPIMMVQGVSIFAAIYNDFLWPQLIFMDDSVQHLSTLMPRLKQLAQSAVGGATYAIYLVSGIPLVITTVISLKFFISGEFAAGLKL